MWNDWTTPQIKPDAYITIDYLDGEFVHVWEGPGKLAFASELICRGLKVGDVFVRDKLTLRVVSPAEFFPPFGYLVMRESFEASCYQRLLPIWGIIQSIIHRILWTLVVWDLVYTEFSLEITWADLRPIRWIKGWIK